MAPLLDAEGSAGVSFSRSTIVKDVVPIVVVLREKQILPSLSQEMPKVFAPRFPT